MVCSAVAAAAAATAAAAPAHRAVLSSPTRGLARCRLPVAAAVEAAAGADAPLAEGEAARS